MGFPRERAHGDQDRLVTVVAARLDVIRAVLLEISAEVARRSATHHVAGATEVDVESSHEPEGLRRKHEFSLGTALVHDKHSSR
jgi:hypothetical protein